MLQACMVCCLYLIVLLEVEPMYVTEHPSTVDLPVGPQVGYVDEEVIPACAAGGIGCAKSHKVSTTAIDGYSDSSESLCWRTQRLLRLFLPAQKRCNPSSHFEQCLDRVDTANGRGQWDDVCRLDVFWENAAVRRKDRGGNSRATNAARQTRMRRTFEK